MIAPAKINTFLKITGKRDNYHLLASRFVRVESLFDELWFEEAEESEHFRLVGDFGCETEKNTIYKAYKALINAGFLEVEDFFKVHCVHVNKNIPEFAGLGGGSSDAATFLLLCKEILSLHVKLDDLARIGESVGADVPFFIYGFKSANVTGIGEIVEEFEEDLPEFEICTPKVHCSTPEIFKEFRQNFWQNVDDDLANIMLTQTSLELIKNYEPSKLNDLFLPAISCYEELKRYMDKGWCMSGSGSSMFRIKNG